MAASPLLVDSSYYIGCLRAGQDPLRALALAAATRDLVICGVVRCEVGRGLRQPSLRQRFTDFWNVMISVPETHRLWTATEDLLWQLDRQGIHIPLTDALIACTAQRAGAVVLTYDQHFSAVPNLRVTDQLDY